MYDLLIDIKFVLLHKYIVVNWVYNSNIILTFSSFVKVCFVSLTALKPKVEWSKVTYTWANFFLWVISVGLITSIVTVLITLKVVLDRKFRLQKKAEYLAKRRLATEYKRPSGYVRVQP